MKRREFLQKGLALGATLLPGFGLKASEWLPLSSVVADDDLVNQIWQAASDGHWNIVKQLLELDPTLITVMGELPISNKAYATLLHQATLKDNLEMVQFLVSKGADIHAEDDSDWTPLHYAAEYCNIDTIEFLLSKGADIHAKEYVFGATPLYLAMWNKRWNKRGEIVKYLVSRGADVLAQDGSGNIPLHWAANYCNIDVVEFLLSKRYGRYMGETTQALEK